MMLNEMDELYAKLQRFKKMLDNGLIEKEDYETIKQDIIAKMGVEQSSSISSNIGGETKIGTEPNVVGGGLFGGQTKVGFEGLEIGQYKVLSLIGQGGMGTVYLGRHKKEAIAEAQGNVAIKLIKPELVQNEQLHERFIKEAALGVKISHPNIAKVITYHEDSQHTAFIMEYIEGKELKEMIPEGGLSPKETIDYLKPLADAVDLLHKQGIIHRDLKPANIKIRPNGSPVILDFGIAKEQNVEMSSVTKTGVAMGTEVYMAPEQMNAKNVDGKADQYSFAMITFELLSGRLPWDEGTTGVMITVAKMTNALKALDSVSSVGEKYSSVVMKGLSLSPEDRFETCTVFVEALEKVGVGPSPEEIEAARIAEQRRKEEEQKIAKEKAEREAARREEEQQKAEEQRLAKEKSEREAARIAEQQRLAQEQKIAREKAEQETARREEQRRKAEEQHLAEQHRAQAIKIDEQRRAQEAWIAQERRKAEALRLEEERRKVQEQRLAEEKRKTVERNNRPITSSEQNNPVKPPAKSNMSLLVGVGSVFAILLGALWFFISTNDQTSETANEQTTPIENTVSRKFNFRAKIDKSIFTRFDLYNPEEEKVVELDKEKTEISIDVPMGKYLLTVRTKKLERLEKKTIDINQDTKIICEYEDVVLCRHNDDILHEFAKTTKAEKRREQEESQKRIAKQKRSNVDIEQDDYDVEVEPDDAADGRQNNNGSEENSDVVQDDYDVEVEPNDAADGRQNNNGNEENSDVVQDDYDVEVEPYEPDESRCDPIDELEDAAMLGSLDKKQSDCLEKELNTATAITDKRKISNILITNALSAKNWKQWERYTKRHLNKYDLSDVNMCYGFAIYIFNKKRFFDAIVWSERGLELRQRFAAGRDFEKKVYTLYKLKTMAANTIWQKTEEKLVSISNDNLREKEMAKAEIYQSKTKNYAREWLNYARASGQKTTLPMQICESAASTFFCQ